MQHIETKFFMMAVVLLTGGLLYLLAPILMPFLLGALLAYLADPLVNKLVSWRMPRLLSVTIVFFLLFAAIILVILLLVPLIERQVATLIETIPDVIAWLQDKIFPWFMTKFGLSEELVNANTLKTMLVKNWTQAGGIADWLLKATLHSGYRMIEWIANCILTPVVTFYLLCDWKKIINGIRNLLPRSVEPTVVYLVKQCDEMLSAFFRGQLLVMLVQAIIYSVGLTLVGLQVSLIVGLFAGLMSIVPYLGFIVGVIIASIAALVEFNSITPVLWVFVVFVVGHSVEHFLLTPKLVGNRIGLHPVAVIFAILAGGKLFGFLGVLLALPVTAVMMVWIRYIYQRYRNSQLYRAY